MGGWRAEADENRPAAFDRIEIFSSNEPARFRFGNEPALTLKFTDSTSQSTTFDRAPPLQTFRHRNRSTSGRPGAPHGYPHHRPTARLH